jgi:hypothetical protein
VYKFISKAAVLESGAFPVRCNCDALLIGRTSEEQIDCEHCGATITPKLVDNQEAVSVRDEQTGEWKNYPVQGYSGERAQHTLQVGDKVLKAGGAERWLIEELNGRIAALKLLGTNRETGRPIELRSRESAPVGVLIYNPD